jgi:ketosteroid isomerase-like protein
VEISRCRRNFSSVLVAIALLNLTPQLARTAYAQSQSPKTSAAAEKEIRAATVLFYDAFNSALKGNLDPMSAVWSHRPDVTDLDADGARATGWNEVRADFQNMVRLYPSGRIAPQDMLIVADGDMGFSVVTETGQLRSADGPMVKFSQRATNIFRREDGQWKLIHHHADTNSTATQGVTR